MILLLPGAERHRGLKRTGVRAEARFPGKCPLLILPFERLGLEWCEYKEPRNATSILMLSILMLSILMLSILMLSIRGVG